MNIILKNKLEENNKTAYWLHKQTGITYACIHNLLNNNTKAISWDTLEKICIALNCTPNDLIQFSKTSNNN